MKKLFLPILLAVLLGCTAYLQDAYGDTINFPINNNRVTRIPTYCGIEPDLPNISDQIVGFWMEEEEKSVLDWKIKLGNANSEHRDRWDMKFVKIPKDSIEFTEDIGPLMITSDGCVTPLEMPETHTVRISE